MLKVTCAIIVKQNRILITQNRFDSDHPNLWEFPGGKINNNEMDRECIIREIKEELDINIKVLKKMHAVEWDYCFRKIELIPFLCEIQTGKIRLNEHADFKWVDFKSLEKISFSEADKALMKIQYNRRQLKKYLRENMNNT